MTAESGRDQAHAWRKVEGGRSSHEASGGARALRRAVPTTASCPEAHEQLDKDRRGDGGNDGAVTHDDGGTDGAVADDGGADAGDSDQACMQASSTSACITCCKTNHPSGSSTFIQAAQTCECASPGVCKTDCRATYCAATPQTPDMTCNTCISNSLDPDAGGACLQPIETACNASQDCLDYVSYANNCP